MSFNPVRINLLIILLCFSFSGSIFADCGPVSVEWVENGTDFSGNFFVMKLSNGLKGHLGYTHEKSTPFYVSIAINAARTGKLVRYSLINEDLTCNNEGEEGETVNIKWLRIIE